jgi:hypothetical protein
MKFESAGAPDYRVLKSKFNEWFSAADILEVVAPELPSDPGLASHLLKVRQAAYDQKAAYILSVAASWAYADIDTMTKMMRLRGLTNNRGVSIGVSNDALFVDTNAHIVQSEDGKVVILCFSGTQPKNAIDWLTDASVKTDPFFSSGYVHGGFYRGFLAPWIALRILLKAALLGYSVCDVRDAIDIMHRCCVTVPPKPGGASTLGRMEALYITGHSLGGALAVLAGAEIHRDPDLSALRDVLRGVYTFGQPMVGDDVFARIFEPTLGKMLFRHVYGKDVVPSLPPVTAGRFVHIGQEYTSIDGGWVARKNVVNQTLLMGLSTFIGVVAWLKEQIPLLSWLPTPISWSDHSPLYYLRTSQQTAPGSELML